MESNFRKEEKRKYIVALICIVLICIVCITFIIFYKSGMFAKNQDIAILGKDNWIVKEVKVNENDIKDSLGIIPRWDEMSIDQQFSQTEYNNNKYYTKNAKISNDNILKNIGNSNLTGRDTYTEAIYTIKADLYSIKNISEKCAIALRFEDDSDYYVYVNSDYRPTILGEFLKDLNLKENTSFGTIYYSYWDKDLEENVMVEFYDVDNKAIWEKLFYNNLDLENIYKDNDWAKYTSERFSQNISISVDIPLLGYKNISVSLTDKGYLITNILDTGKGFYIGEDKVQEFLDYVKENYEGYKIVYVYENEGNINEENDSREEEIILVENNVVNTTIIDSITAEENKIEANPIIKEE